MMESLSKADDVTAGDHAWPGNVGYYHTPKRFLSMAKQTLHPRDTTDHLEVERKKNLLQAMLLAAQMRLQEMRYMRPHPNVYRRCCTSKRFLFGQSFWRSFT